MKIYISIIILWFSSFCYVTGQHSPISVNFWEDSIQYIHVTIIGIDTNNFTIKNSDSINLDFYKSEVYKIKLKANNTSLIIDGIKNDIVSLSVKLDGNSPNECSYFVDRNNPIIATQTDCMGMNCKHKIYAYNKVKQIPVLWVGAGRGYKTFGEPQIIKKRKIRHKKLKNLFP